MKFKEVVNLKISSPLFRGILKTVFKEGKFYKIRFGRLRGLKSYYRKDINFHTLMGLWETDSLEMLDKILIQFELQGKDIIVADIGACLLYTSPSPRD